MKTMSSVCLDAIKSGGVWSVGQLYEKVLSAGIEGVVEAQVYSTMQVYASQKKIARGQEKRTYVALDSNVPASVRVPSPVVPDAPAVVVGIRSDKVKKVKAPVEKKAKAVKVFDAVALISEVQGLLGDPYATILKGAPYCILLDETYTAASLVARLKAVLGANIKWLWYKNGNGYIVGGEAVE